ncbi:MAG: hypothetical protein AUG48_01425 [Actinobacteria bacterium 13_1_20CM_3_68_9]|nr:MAG: hypothetical protein AUG48_01425 [Actinobacteria bacterium 13_1_20CM_3_68_9]
MPLTGDQQALLQLLLERGQRYADLASLLGVDEAEVRTRARAALTELAGADPDRNVGLTDYLLGQADPIGRADAVRHLKDDPQDLDLATELSQKLRLVAPQADLPRLPGEERRPRPRRGPRRPLSRLPIPARLRRERGDGEPTEEAPSVAAAPPRGPRTTLSRHQTQLIVGLGSGAVLAIAIILGVTGAFSSGGDSTTSTTTSTTPTTASSGPQGFPVTDVAIKKSGKFQNTFAIPQAFQALLPRTQAVYLTLAKKKVISKAIHQAVSSGQPLLTVQGKTAFTGIVNTANARKKVIPIPLQASKGVAGSGAAALGVASANQPFFDLRLSGVKQAPKGSAYIVWFVLA